MLLIRSAVAVAMIAVAGCATQAQKKLESIQGSTKASVADSKACFEAVKARPEFSSLLVHTFDGRPSMSQLADNTYLSDADGRIVLSYFDAGNQCRAILIKQAGNINPEMSQAFESRATNQDRLRLALVNHKITWGQYYQGLVDIQATFLSEARNADHELMSQLKNEHQEEVARRAAAASAFAAAVQAQQESQQRQQMINSINRPVQTNCYRSGDSTNCTSY